MKNKATKLVSAALLGLDIKVVLVNSKRYTITPPTIGRLAGAAYHLADIANAETILDILKGQECLEGVAKALSYFICGSDKLADELSHGTMEEIVTALTEAYSMIDVEGFMMLSALAKNVGKMIAKPKL